MSAPVSVQAEISCGYFWPVGLFLRILHQSKEICYEQNYHQMRPCSMLYGVCCACYGTVQLEKGVRWSR